jgi:ABC-type molybdenum transport system ATPase subunit/photorepair protein PhrA
MLVTHPYIKDMRVEETKLSDGRIDRVLVVRSKIKKPSFLSAQNDNSFAELARQLRSLDTLAKNGFADFNRVEIRNL